MFQRLPIALFKVKTGNTSKNLLNEIQQIMYTLYPANEIQQELLHHAKQPAANTLKTASKRAI